MTTTRTPVVFIHGLWLHATSWAPWVELFREAVVRALRVGPTMTARIGPTANRTPSMSACYGPTRSDEVSGPGVLDSSTGADLADDELQVKVERPERSEDVRP